MNDPSVKWMPKVTVGNFPYLWLPVQIIYALYANILAWIVSFLGLFVVIPATYYLSKHLQWPAWSKWFVDYDDFEPESWWWEEGAGSNKAGGHWSTRNRWLGIYWWHAVRNPASYFKRYAFNSDCTLEELRTTIGSHHGSLNPTYTILQGKKFAYRVRWDIDRPWLLWVEFTRRWNNTKYMYFKFGFKLGAIYDGLGVTLRFHPYRTFSK